MSEPPIPSHTPGEPPSAVAEPPRAPEAPATGTERQIPLPISVQSADDARRAVRREAVAAALHRTAAEETESAANDGRTRQGSLLVMPVIRDGHEQQLRTLLAEIANPPRGEDLEVNPHVPFLKLRTVHFARILVHAESPSKEAPIPVWDGKPQAHGPRIPPKLLFSTDFDGPLDEHLDELLEVAGPGLDRIFSHCEGWPGLADRDAALGFILLNQVPTSAFYTGTMNRSVDQIRREARLRDRVEAYLDEETRRPGFPSDPVQIRERIRAWVFAQPDLAWTRQKPGPSPKLLLPQWWVNKLYLYTGIAAAIVLLAAAAAVGLSFGWKAAAWWIGLPLAVLFAVAGAGYAYLRHLSATDPVIIPPGVDDHTAKLVETEDRIVQNEMSSVIYVKEPLWFRGIVLRAVMAFVNFAAKYLSNQGALVGIPSIHFARWVIVDGGRRLVFFSNFDGSWENYLGDFIDKAHGGLTSVWSNCVGFPRTVGLSGEGATDEQKFKAYSRASQIPTQVWYSAYKWLSVPNVNNNSKIRLGLYGEMTPKQAGEWLRRF